MVKLSIWALSALYQYHFIGLLQFTIIETANFDYTTFVKIIRFYFQYYQNYVFQVHFNMLNVKEMFCVSFFCVTAQIKGYNFNKVGFMDNTQ